MKRAGSIRRQRPVQGGRERIESRLTPSLASMVERLAARYHVSRPFVESVLIAIGLGQTPAEHWNDPLPKKRRAR